MEDHILIVAFITFIVQSYSAWIVSFATREKAAKREVTDYIKNLYSSLPKVTLVMYVLTIGKKFLGLPVEMTILEVIPILAITVFATALLFFYPYKLTCNLVTKLKLELN